MADNPLSAGDPLPANCELIELHVAELRELFNAMDASPFRKRDLDQEVEEFIVGWAQESPSKAKLGLLVSVSNLSGPPDEPGALRDAIHDFFKHRARVSRTKLREMLKIGRVSLLVGLLFLGLAVGAGSLVVATLKTARLGELLREGLVIIGWVAMWRPLEIFLYDWWPIRLQARLYDRLGMMPVQIAYDRQISSESWRELWRKRGPSVSESKP